MTSVLVLPVLAASLVGSLHCAGMCGPIVAFYSGGDATAGKKRWLSHLAYHGGRLSGYGILGALAGALGAAIDLAGAAAGVGRIAIVIAGVLMILWGVALLFEAGGIRLPRLGVTEGLSARAAATLRRLKERPPVLRAGMIGVLTALMPCGWLYAFAVTAAGTGSVLGGMAVMSAFWVGTVPILLGIGVGAQVLFGRLRPHVPMVAAVVLIGVGMYAVIGRFNVPSLAARAVHPSSEVPGAHHCH